MSTTTGSQGKHPPRPMPHTPRSMIWPPTTSSSTPPATNPSSTPPPTSRSTTHTIAALHQRLDALMEASRSADDRLRAMFKPRTMTVFAETRLSDLSDAIAMSRGIPTKATARDGGELPVLSVPDLRLGSAAPRFIDTEVLDDYGLRIPEPGDVLRHRSKVARSAKHSWSPKARFRSSRHSRWPSSMCSTNPGSTPGISVHGSPCEPAREQLRRLARGAGIQRIPIKELENLIIPIPSLRIQHEIGERFVTFETAIESHRAIAACLEQLCALDLAVNFAEAKDASAAPAEKSDEEKG